MLDIVGTLPQALPILRPARKDDLCLLVDWIEAGRKDGHFRSGAPLTEDSVIAYQNSFDLHEYQCMIIELNDIPIGYIDFVNDSELGEILGFYIVPSERGKKIGQYVLRWTSCYLREHGCRRVSLDIYSHNSASIGASRAAGFQIQPKGREEGKLLCEASRVLVPLARFAPCNPAYNRLKGVDKHLDHASIAEIVAENIKELAGVDVILGLGSIARGFGDQWSDIDLAILGRGAGMADIPRGEVFWAGTSLDLIVVDLDKQPPSTWDNSRKQAFQESVVLFARAPHLAIELANILPLSRDEEELEICRALVGLGWLGFQPRGWFGRDLYGYSWSVPHDLWLHRGCLASAQASLDKALALFEQLVFLCNSVRVPDPKWRRYLLPELGWLPDEAEALGALIEDRRMSIENFAARSGALFSLVEQVVAKLEQENRIPEDVYRTYIQAEDSY